MTRRRTLRGALARLVAATSLVSLLVFSAVAYLGIYLEDEAGLKIVPEADDDATKFLLLAFGLAAPVSLAVTIAGALWLGRRSMRPIEEVIRATGAMSVERLDRRLPLPDREDELHDMVQSLNRLFARLEDGFEGLRSFAADASHELRTPLAAAISELEVAARRPRSEEEWKQAIERALTELRRMVELVDSLLELARGGIAGPDELVDVTALVDEVVGMYSARSQAAGVSLEHTSTATVAGRGNRAALAAALGAIVANALRYTPRGGRAEVIAAAGSHGGLVIHVDDSGPGVPADERTEVFAPLQRGSAGRGADRSDGYGLGLGLAIARRVMQQHGGTVAVGDSSLGGARFTLELPAPPASS